MQQDPKVAKKQNEEELDEQIEEVKTVKAKTAKEMKAMYKPEFRKNPSKYYPVKVFEKYNFSRATCKCGTIYWRRTEARDTCGDSECVGSYQFIGTGFGQGVQGKKLTYAEAWQKYAEVMSSKDRPVPCTAIERYPVVARWRNDVDYVAAGIFCFQPYCVTGELEPPANPLVQPQFCLRFNDLDNIGLSGRHYSGFIMLGNQVFNTPGDYKYFDEECVEYHLEWLLSMGCDLDEITLVEDVWSGGGNLGSSIEIFAKGLEVGNMVFTRFKYFPSGDIEELDVKVIDVGIGLERIPWLINGSSTSYQEVFGDALKLLVGKLEIDMNQEVWQKFGPYTTLFNVDENEDIEGVWKNVAGIIGLPVKELQDKILPIKELFIILDHTRTMFMAIYDGSLPSNVGGGSNVRNIIRRTFAILKKNNWWGKIGGIDGFLEILNEHKKDLALLFGQFQEYKSFEEIIKKEYNSWLNTDSESKVKLDKLLKKKKNQLDIKDWITAVTTFGIPADMVAEITGQPIPGNFYYVLSEEKERVQKCQEAILYNTAHLKETTNLYYVNHRLMKFDSKVQEIFANVTQKNVKNIVILEESAFYPTSGGQLNDIGKLTILNEVYNIVNVEKVGKSVLHILDRPIQQDDDKYIGQVATLEIDEERRSILRNHHTATHIVFAACRKVLGPHVWQNGAKKTTQSAHLDITHYQRLTKEKELEIENMANTIILQNHQIEKGLVDKAEAEKQHGFRLYQGGIVPGNTLRVVNIKDIDVEACCGTHCDSTSEVGWIKILKTSRIQDGIVRLYFVAGVKCMDKLNSQSEVITSLMDMWGIGQGEVVSKAQDFFTRTKKAEKEVEEQSATILNLRMENLAFKKTPLTYYKAMETESRFYIAFMKNYIKEQQENKQGTIFIGRTKPEGDRFVFGQFGNATLFDHEKFLEVFKDENNPNPSYFKIANKISLKDGKKNVNYDGILQFCYNGKISVEKIEAYLQTLNFVEGKV